MEVFYVAFMLAFSPQSIPAIVEVHTSRDTCISRAIKLNQNVEEIRRPEYRKHGAGYVCLQLVPNV